jgi:hypothetical protein
MIYIHIGLHKTGSSTIQQFAAGNVDLLARHNIVYPGIGRSRAAHHQLKDAVKDDKDTDLLPRIVAEIAADPAKDYLISAEGLSTLKPAAVKRFLEPLQGLGPIKVILYVRSAAGLVVSSYNQVTKRSLNMASFDEFFRFRTEGREITHVVDNWGGILGYDALRIRTIEASALAGGDLLTDLCEAIGLGKNVISEADPASIERANVGVPWEVAEYMREFSRRAADMLEELRPKLRERLLKSKTLRARVVEARAAQGTRRAKVETLRLSEMATIVQSALEAQGKGGRVQYLTPEQAQAMEERYQVQLAQIAEKVPDTQLSHTPPAPLPARPFEPSFAQIAPERLAAIEKALSTEYDFDDMPAPLRDVFTGMHAPVTAK